MKTINAILPLLALLIASCTSDFDLEDMGSEEKLVLYCMPAAGLDTTLIQLSRSVPVNDKGLPPLGIPGAEITVKVNGEPRTVYWNEERETASLQPQCYYVLTPGLKEGDVVSIEAEADGLRPVMSETVVPPVFPVRDISLAVIPGSEMRLQFRITFADEAATDDYYAIGISSQSFYESGYYDDGYMGTHEWICKSDVYPVENVLLDFKDEPLLNDRVGLDATLDFDYEYYKGIYIWSDEQIPGREYTLRVSAYYSPDRGGYPDWNQTFGKFEYLYKKYKVRLYRLSPELYKYLKAMNDIANNEFGQSGLAPIRNHYTNIINGFGVMGACQIYESEWLANPSLRD